MEPVWSFCVAEVRCVEALHTLQLPFWRNYGDYACAVCTDRFSVWSNGGFNQPEARNIKKIMWHDRRRHRGRMSWKSFLHMIDDLMCRQYNLTSWTVWKKRHSCYDRNDSCSWFHQHTLFYALMNMSVMIKTHFLGDQRCPSQMN